LESTLLSSSWSEVTLKKDIFPLTDYDVVCNPEEWTRFVDNKPVFSESVQYIEWYLDIEKAGGSNDPMARLLLDENNP
jgi:hypothetical protein